MKWADYKLGLDLHSYPIYILQHLWDSPECNSFYFYSCDLTEDQTLEYREYVFESRSYDYESIQDWINYQSDILSRKRRRPKKTTVIYRNQYSSKYLGKELPLFKKSTTV